MSDQKKKQKTLTTLITFIWSIYVLELKCYKYSECGWWTVCRISIKDIFWKSTRGNFTYRWTSVIAKPLPNELTQCWSSLKSAPEKSLCIYSSTVPFGGGTLTNDLSTSKILVTVLYGPGDEVWSSTAVEHTEALWCLWCYEHIDSICVLETKVPHRRFKVK